MARELRKQDTPAEQILWESVRNRKLNGIKFRRQHPLGRFILDFYAPESKLVVELDGGIYIGNEEMDSERTKFLEAYGNRVIRFTNEEVQGNLADVLARIHEACKGPHPAKCSTSS